MEYRLDKNALLETLGQWNAFLKRRVHLVACGGTALTLMGVKPSTKDCDFMVPVRREHAYLTRTLKNLGYKPVTGSGWMKRGESFIFDLFSGRRIHTTELLDDPLQTGHHKVFKEFSHLYVGILNEYDLIASKLFRGTDVRLASERRPAKHLSVRVPRRFPIARRPVFYNRFWRRKPLNPPGTPHRLPR